MGQDMADHRCHRALAVAPRVYVARSDASYLKIIGGGQVSLAAYGIPAELPPGDCASTMLTLRRAG
ncbi:hypothetical protein D3105_08445 [Streptomyces globisporus]|uniref:Uncharacterized protein n=1 Tax=Streptomyces globisporus TaxID=1908 RepID=A0A423V315_STRGL|nr:hypothetical protein D3105_08445 [Streptomyces globisporus]